MKKSRAWGTFYIKEKKRLYKVIGNNSSYSYSVQKRNTAKHGIFFFFFFLRF